VHAAPLSVLEATYSINDVRLVERQDRQQIRPTKALYRSLTVRVSFDQPLYVSKLPLESLDSGRLQIDLQGLTRLHCGDSLYESHPVPDHVDNVTVLFPFYSEGTAASEMSIRSANTYVFVLCI